MLISLLTQHPEALPSILARTPTWVWGLLAGLIALGASQLFHRRASIARTALLPVSMAGLSVYSLASALSASGQLPALLLTWLTAAALTAFAAMAWRVTPPQGTRFDAAHRCFELPGSAVPMLLILAIFLTKYGVGVELAMQPALVQDTGFAITLSAVYGVFNGIFAARALRLWLLTRHPSPTSHSAPTIGA